MHFSKHYDSSEQVSVIHAMHHEQDISKHGWIEKTSADHASHIPDGCIAIAGIPPSPVSFEDEILSAAYSANIIYWITGDRCNDTAFTVRLYRLPFLGEFRGMEEQRHHLHESPSSMTIPLVILAILSIAAGFIGIPELFMKDGHSLASFLDPVFAESARLKQIHHPDHATEYILIGVSVLAAIIASLVAWNRFSKRPDLEEAQGFGKVLGIKVREII